METHAIEDSPGDQSEVHRFRWRKPIIIFSTAVLALLFLLAPPAFWKSLETRNRYSIID